MNKVLVFSDMHVYPTNEVSELLPGGTTTYLKECEDTFDWLVDLIEEESPDWVVNCGDTLHTQGFADSLSVGVIYEGASKLDAACKKHGSKLFWLIGNHDMYRDVWDSSVHSLPFVPGLVDKVLWEDNALFIPYTKDLESVRHALQGAGDNVDVIFSHLEFVGASYGSAVSRVGLLPSEMPVLTINGHYHYPQVLGSVVLVGSCMYHNFRDRIGTTRRGATVVDVAEREVRWVTNPHTSIYHSVYLNSPGDQSKIEELAATEEAARTHLRAVLSSPVDFDRPEPGAFRSFRVVDLAPQTIERRDDVDASLDSEAVLAGWVDNFCGGAGIESGDFLFLKDDLLSVGNDLLATVASDLSHKYVDFSILGWQVENFMSLESGSVSVTDGLSLVEAKNEDAFGADSNGVGKSALFEALYWALYGRTIRGLRADDVIRKTPKESNGRWDFGDPVKEGTKVSVKIQKGDRVYTVSRYRGRPKQGDNFEITSDDIADPLSPRLKGDGQKVLVEEILGVTPDVFLQTIFLGSGLDTRFSKLSDTERKTLIESFIGTGIYADAGKEASAAYAEHTSRLVRLGSALSGLEGKASSFSSSCSSLETKIEEAEEEQSRREAEADEQLAKYRVELGTCEASLEELGDSPPEQSYPELDKEIADEDTKLRDAEVALSKCTSEWSKWSKLGSGECPTCGAELDKKACEEELTTASAVVQETAKEIEDIKTRRRELKRKLINSVALGQKKTAAWLSNHRKLSKEQSRIKELVASVKGSYGLAGSYASALQEELDRNEALLASAEVDAAKKRLEMRMEEREGAKLKFWQDSFSPTGLRSFLLDKSLTYMNVRLAHYADQLIGGDLIVQLSSVKKLKTAGERAKIDLVVEGSGSNYAGSSSGQKRRVDLCIQFALHDLLRSFRGGANLLIVDEIDAGLDSTGLQRLVNTLSSFDRSVFLVTHNPNLRSLVSGQFVGRSLTVSRRGGVSNVNSQGGRD